MKKGIEFEKMDGTKLKIGIVVARWNSEITDALFDQCKQALLDSGVENKNILVNYVPGSYETVYAAKNLIGKESVDVVVCLGALVKGETMHFEYISDAVTYGIMKLNVETGVPVIFGILTCLNEQQALDRSVGDKSHGYNWGLSAVEMALLNVKK